MYNKMKNFMNKKFIGGLFISFIASLISVLVFWVLMIGTPLYGRIYFIFTILLSIFLLINTILFSLFKDKDKKKGILVGYIFIVIPFVFSILLIQVVEGLSNVGRGI